ncbi:MAG TPA: adenylyl-sulfate kinase [Terrimicrobiaceae bacterium]|nr:adenylyl-sulfate kinase [Terrimicrobiaceae bacterium]
MTSPQKLKNPATDNLSVTPDERAARDGQSGLVVWFTGLSGAGKTTLAVSVERRLFDDGYRTFLIDGDLLRTGLCSDLGFDAADRHENVRRAGVVSGLMASAGLICLTALISPFRSDRLGARSLLPPESFLEVYVNAPLAICEARDVKGLYRRARANEIPNFTGISSAYEPPETPDLEVRTDLLTVEESIDAVLAAVNARLLSIREGDSLAQRERAVVSKDRTVASR